MNRLEAVGEYLGSVGNRVIGRAEWQETTQQRQRPLNKFLYAGAQVYYPLFSRISVPFVYKGGLEAVQEKANSRRTPLSNRKLFLEVGKDLAKILLPVGIDMTLLYACSNVARNEAEFVGLWMLRNAATQVGLDIITGPVTKGAQRLFRHFRPSNTPLAV